MRMWKDILAEVLCLAVAAVFFLFGAFPPVDRQACWAGAAFLVLGLLFGLRLLRLGRDGLDVHPPLQGQPEKADFTETQGDAGTTAMLRAYGTRNEAEYAQSVLEEAGIPSILNASDCGGMTPFLASGEGVVLLVLKEDFERARELLK